MKKSMFLVAIMILSCILVYAQEPQHIAKTVRLMGDYNGDSVTDFYFVILNGKQHKTEIRILNGVNKRTMLYNPTPLHETDETWQFLLNDYNADKVLDLYAINKNTGDIHILDGAKKYETFLLRTSSVLPNLANSIVKMALIDFNGDGIADLCVMSAGKKQHATIYVINGADKFQSFLFKTVSVLKNAEDLENVELTEQSILDGALGCENKEEETVEVATRGNAISSLISVARGELGYKEGANNDTKYGKWYGLNYNPWCAMFVSWCANKAGISTSIIPKHALCSAGAQWFMDRKIYKKRSSGYTPKKGDIIYFDYGKGIHHIGIVESVSNGNVNTIEGNTSDMVARRSYSLSKSSIHGYGCPKY